MRVLGAVSNINHLDVGTPFAITLSGTNAILWLPEMSDEAF
jgi:hypothetical protein